MPRDAGGESSERREPGRMDDWARIEQERADRDRAGRTYDATHDPSEEFELAARPLSPEYGRERSRQREIPAGVAAEFGLTPEQASALRERMFAEQELRAKREEYASDTRPPDAPRMSLDTRLGSAEGTATARVTLVRFAGPDGLTDRQRLADETYAMKNQRERPWLKLALREDPLVLHVYCERDRAGGHDPARHDGFRDDASQEQRAAASKDPAHPSDSPAYQNSVDRYKGTPPPDHVGGKGKQHTLGEHVSWIADPTAWAVATARAIEHPEVKAAIASDKPPRNVKVPLEDVLGPDGHRYVDGYSLVMDGFDSPKAALANRDNWVHAVRQAIRDQGLERGQAEQLVEQMSANGEIPWVRPEVRRIGTFEGGSCQVNLAVEDRVVVGIPTICYNPPRDDARGT